MHAQSVQNYCTVFSLSSMQICGVFVAVDVVVAQAPYLRRCEFCHYSTFIAFKRFVEKYEKTIQMCAPLNKMKRIEDLQLLKLSSKPKMRYFTLLFCSTELFQSASCTCSTLIFRHPTNETHNLKRCHSRYRCLY